MRTEIETGDLVVWAPQESLAEAKSLFAPYSPKFQTVPCNEMKAFAKATVSVLYLSNPEQDITVESALAALRQLQSVEVARLHAARFFGFCIPRGNDGRTSEVHRRRVGFQLATLEAAFESAEHPDPTLGKTEMEVTTSPSLKRDKGSASARRNWQEP